VPLLDAQREDGTLVEVVRGLPENLKCRNGCELALRADHSHRS
jgi:hypothetical protein